MSDMLGFVQSNDIILDNAKLERIILKAKFVGYSVKEIRVNDELRGCIVSKDKDNILYILDTIERLNNNKALVDICEGLRDLTGKLRIVGGRNLISTSRLFESCQFEEYDFSGFKAENIVEMKNMFAYIHTYELNLYELKTDKVEDMEGMFYMASILKLSIGCTNTDKVTNFDKFFAYSIICNIDLENLRTPSAKSMRKMFMMSNIKELNLRKFDISKLEYMDNMFESCNADKIDLGNLDFSNVKSMNSVLYQYKGKLVTVDEKLLRLYKISMRAGM